MINLNKKKIGTLAVIVSVAAVSLTLKSNYVIPRDSVYDTNELRNKSIVDTIGTNVSSFYPYYVDFLDDTADTLRIRQEDRRVLDSLINEAKNYLKKPLLFYAPERIDSLINSQIDSLANAAVNRPMILDEALVRTVLDTVNNYTEVVDRYFVQANIREESWYTRDIVSSAKAVGYGQFTKDTWKRYGEGSFSNAYNPVKNIRATVRYMKVLEEKFSKELGIGHSRKQKKWNQLTIEEQRYRIAAAYNGGPDRFLGHKVQGDFNKMPVESKNHAAKVDKARNELKQEDLFRNIALYKDKVEKNKPDANNTVYYAFLPYSTENLFQL